ncbi:MAG TPA: PIN domain-containing protein [Pyrinomonadaceae bacterium]|nr:PIN domain-containing protein [Pyrinomonadaceae bacterium]
MRKVFADTFYWAALINPRDQWHESALRVRERIHEEVRLVTTESVLIELMNYFCEYGGEMRNVVIEDIRDIMVDSNITYVEHGPTTFLDAIALYEQRPYKGYSLTDCISMLVMRDHGISEVLTHDSHFEQEGFVVLL